jgi:hypothetical protein
VRPQAPVPAADGREAGRRRGPGALEWLKGRRVFAFSGIATPESFEKFLRDLGALLVGRERFLDHYRYTPEDLEELYDAAERERAECLVTTEKDAVRISDAAGSPLPIYYLRLEIEIIRGAADFDEAVGRICFPQNALAGRAPPGVIGFAMIIDPRFTQLAEGLTGFSTASEEGRARPHRRVRRPRRHGDRADARRARAGARCPTCRSTGPGFRARWRSGPRRRRYESLSEIELARMRQMDAYIALRGSENIFEASDVPSARVQLVSRLMKPVIDHRVNKTKWVVLGGRRRPWPSRPDEHRGLRGFLLQGLHARLLADEAGDEGARRADVAGRTRCT